MSITRYHFVAGLPMSGQQKLLSLLAQNPRFLTRADGVAARVFAQIAGVVESGEGAAAMLDVQQRSALLRSVLDSVYHDRPLESVIFDASADWLEQAARLARIFPLSRFIVCVRSPAAIVDLVATQSETPPDQIEALADAMLAPDHELGRALAALRLLMAGRHSERVLLIDYERLCADPEFVLDVLYDFLRETEFSHRLEDLAANAGPERPLDEPFRLMREDGDGRLPARLARALGAKAFWRGLRRTEARLLLPL